MDGVEYFIDESIYRNLVTNPNQINMIEEDCPERCPCCYRENSNHQMEH